MKILKTLCGQRGDLAALDEDVYTRGTRFEVRQNGRTLAKLRVVSGGLFPIAKVEDCEVALDELEGLEVRKTR